MKAFITGATGFVGSHLAEELVKRGYEVSVLIRRTSNLRWLSSLSLKYVFGSAESLSGADVIKEIESADYIYHLAGVTKALKEETYYRVNRDGTIRMCEMCEKHAKNLKKLVIISTLAVYGPKDGYEPIKESDEVKPISPYGKSKLEGDKSALNFSSRVPLVIVRPGAIYGPRDTDFFRVIKVAVRYGIIPVPGFKRKVVNLAFVKDVVELIIRAGESRLNSGEVFLAGGFNHTWEEVREVLSKVSGRKVRILKLPKSLVYLSSVFGEIISQITGNPLPLSVTRVKDLLGDNWSIDLSKAERLLGFKPSVSLEDGMRITIEWYRKEGML